MTPLDQNTVRTGLLRGWLAPRLDPLQLAWLDDQIARIATGSNVPAAALAIGLAPLRFGKADLSLTPAEIATGARLRAGLDPSGWSVDQAARILFVLATFDGDEARFAERLDRLFVTGELREHVALFRGLSLYPGPERLVGRAAEGIRSAVQPVFEAVAHANPYPSEQFSETQWNHMVLKALFIGSTLDRIQGLDRRRNADLAKMLIDYAHERWAAGRPVSPELWRGVGPFADESAVADLAKVLRSDSEPERKAAALALAECPLPDARAVLSTAPALAADVSVGRIAW